MPLQMQIVFEDEFGEGLFFLMAHDLSLGGLALDGGIPLKIGAMVLLSFTLPDRERKIRVTGEIVRRFSGDGRGMGIRFVGLSGGVQQRLERFLRGEH
jgi:Tfp pilus assembly protein PilZ